MESTYFRKSPASKSIPNQNDVLRKLFIQYDDPAIYSQAHKHIPQIDFVTAVKRIGIDTNPVDCWNIYGEIGDGPGIGRL